MFDLEKAADTWIRSHGGRHCLYARRRAHADGSADELKDHLLCEVERLEKEGLTTEQAFRQATAALEKEIAGDGHGHHHRHHHHHRRHLQLGNAIVWAAVMIASALLLARGEAPAETGSWLLLFVLVPAWWATDLIIRRHAGHPHRH